MLLFEIVKYAPSDKVSNRRCYLVIDNWDDYHYKTLFELYYSNANGEIKKIGGVKIGKVEMLEKGRITNHLEPTFNFLPDAFFSLGQGEDYYGELLKLSQEEREEILRGLKDIAFDEEIFKLAINEEVTNTSLMRSITHSEVTGQYRRMSRGGVKQIEYKFAYNFAENDPHAISNQRLTFSVIPNSLPPSNLHIIIGRNGVGKTTLLKKITKSFYSSSHDCGHMSFGDELSFNGHVCSFGQNDSAKFANVIYISFSAFDAMTPSEMDEKLIYIGLKKIIMDGDKQEVVTKSLDDLTREFSKSFSSCNGLKKNLILSVLNSLNYDLLFRQENILDLAEAIDTNDFKLRSKSKEIFGRLSSGHKIVLLTVTKLVETVEEKTLVVFDEPEAHLHPPLLSALIRTISDLLIARNGVAIIATHSPVVLQEVPKSCVWVINRTTTTSEIARPAIETFGEGVGILTREIFGLEVTETGFHKLIEKNIEGEPTYHAVLERFGGSLGGEAKALTKLLIISRDS